MTTPIPPHLKVLFFDVFGTCVAQITPVADELHKATQTALESSSISDEVRAKAAEMTYNHWCELAVEWNAENEKFVNEGKKRGVVDWREVDEQRIELLPKLLAQRGLILPLEDASTSLQVKEGSLFNETQLRHLGTIWHRLTPWPDTCAGLSLLNKKYSTVTLSNTYRDLMKGLVANSSIPFQHIYTAETFSSFKPHPKVYLGAAEKMGVKPEECALVAAHLGDLKGAKACGFFAIYVEREGEEKSPELRGEGIPDLVVGMREGGFVGLARRLGIEVD